MQNSTQENDDYHDNSQDYSNSQMQTHTAEKEIANGITNSSCLNENDYPQHNMLENEDIEDKIQMGNPAVTEKEHIHIVPGTAQDPFRNYRLTKQICLVLVWVCLVSIYFS